MKPKHCRIERTLLQCPLANDVWEVAPVRWDGAKNQRCNFTRWWGRITEAKARQEGNSHIGLTANILWQIRKERNKREFENHDNHQPCKVIQKAHKEWLEIEEVNRQESDQSTTETMPDLEGEHPEQEDQDLIRLNVTTTSSVRPVVLGIGVAINSRSHAATKYWALKNKSHGNKNMDVASAVRLVLCKALGRGWHNIKVHIQNKEVLRQIKHGTTSDGRLTMILDDIFCLKSLFLMCSFCLNRNDNSITKANVSSYALGIWLDEEASFPLYC